MAKQNKKGRQTARKKQVKKTISYRPFVLILCLISLLALGAFGFSWMSDWQKSHRIEMQSDSSEAFISSIADTAQSLGQTYGIYASVMIAQAMLESNNGKSDLSQAPYYNLFGIKGEYYGESVVFETQEDDGEGNLTTIYDNFRAYPSYYHSMEDYAQLLSSELYYDAWKENTMTYEDATEVLAGLYASDTQYARKLNQLIEDYHLTQYDS